ncbi:serine hydrolase domain-containing protein [Saccharomonospora xinjiangensis]|uniref:Penicillin-binding protein, beta-lactamase class C n=1 Tax=Saccharomonospora xinjiangensis XJ-54 TaxID=882086 RepID=I0UY57_9PSEU|nr:serine hydrolase domain-containing protein [Saccharomonospora xinjiangensis]EID52810.1 penicillin-binding protein, beta-lactamase class C [Saccharomonospora xinjiangensis XJ-54]
MTTTSNRQRLTGLAGGAALAVTTVIAPVAEAQEDDHAETQAVLNQYQSIAGPGAAVFAGDADEAWTLTAGTAEFGKNRPITAQDHFRSGSQTKTFVAAVVLQLVDEGRVELDAPIEKYLPGVVTGNYDGNVITVRQLLQHTSGLARFPSDANPGPDGTYVLADLVRAAMDEPPVAGPGEKSVYSNTGYQVLGMLIEEITGQYAGDAITERIIEPLGLEGTSFPAPGERALAEPFVHGYAGGRIPPFYLWIDNTTGVELSIYSTAGAMESTLQDSVTFFRALADGEVVSDAAWAEMHKTVPGNIGGVGLGINEIPLSCGGTYWAKNGGVETGHVSTTGVTDDGRFASVVTNTFSTAVAEKSFDVLDSALCE